MIPRTHKHAYAYRYMLKKRAPHRGYDEFEYVMHTDIDNPRSAAARAELAKRFEIFLGFEPKMIRYKHDTYAK